MSEKMSKQDEEAWLDMVDQSRIDTMLILQQISQGFIQEDGINKLLRVIPMAFDAVAILGPRRWQQILSIHQEKASEEKKVIV